MKEVYASAVDEASLSTTDEVSALPASDSKTSEVSQATSDDSQGSQCRHGRCGSFLVVDENMRATVGRETKAQWPLAGAGVYNLRITRASGFTAHCEGSVIVLRSDTGEVLWGINSWRSDKGGVDASLSIPMDEQCEICVTMQAHHFTSAVVRAGASDVNVCLAKKGVIKGRFSLRKSDSMGSLDRPCRPTFRGAHQSDDRPCQSAWTRRERERVSRGLATSDKVAANTTVELSIQTELMQSYHKRRAAVQQRLKKLGIALCTVVLTLLMLSRIHAG